MIKIHIQYDPYVSNKVNDDLDAIKVLDFKITEVVKNLKQGYPNINLEFPTFFGK